MQPIPAAPIPGTPAAIHLKLPNNVVVLAESVYAMSGRHHNKQHLALNP